MTTIRTAHAAATPAVTALRLLAGYTPIDADDAWALLASLHDHGADSIVSGLLAAIHRLRETIGATPGVDQDAAQRIGDCLQAATEIISGAAADWIDRAREQLPESEDDEAEGIPSWELSPAPTEGPNASSADGWSMHTLAAHAVREGDLLPLGSWRRVVFVHDDREGGVQLTLERADGQMGTLQIVAAEPLAILRPAAADSAANARPATPYGDSDGEQD